MADTDMLAPMEADGRNPTDIENGERQLWHAVILQAFDDATYRGSSHTASAARDHARAWLTKPNADFDRVCSLAGLDPIATRERCIKAIAQIDGSPSEPTAPITLTVDGVTKTLSDWSLDTGLSYSALRSRMERGLSPEKVIATTKSAGGIVIEFEGRSQTLKEWARETRVSAQTITWRIKSGWPVGAALWAPTSKGGKARNVSLLQPATPPGPGGGCPTSQAGRGPAPNGTREIAAK